jgi:hypothetical protein
LIDKLKPAIECGEKPPGQKKKLAKTREYAAARRR